MDPLTAFSLACGVIQVVDFSTKTLSKCKELYKEGSLSEYQDLEDLTNRLVDVRDKLESTTARQNLGTLDAIEDQSLLEVAAQCSKTAELLVEKFRSLKIEGPHKRRQAVLKTVKVLREKRELRDIQRRLDGYRDVLDTQILINLRQRFDLASLQHRKDFQNIDQEVQSLINIVSQGPKGFDELKDLMLKGNKEMKETISSGFREHESRQAEREQQTQLVKSLWFPEILHREETIAEAHRKTFQWIFDQSGRTVRPWDNFIAWLKNGEGIYWISGKAGSGKSTLMSFLCQDERTKKALETWSGTKDIIMAKFFFWSAGTMMQKNFGGFLRSLLWQILRELPDMNILSSGVGSSLEQKSRRASYSQAIGVWTKRRLGETLHEAINQLRTSCCLCFFIDGLDEFDDDKDALIEFLQSLVSKNGVKVCLSSRLDKEFQDAFGSSATLRLQDLTYEDIRQYVDDEFQKVPQLVLMASENEAEMNKVKAQIVHKAEGIFLWVSLAVKDQIRGLRNDDSPKQLQERLSRLPNEIEGIYTRMLDRIDPIYLQEASMLLKMALYEPDRYQPELSILELALASFPGLEDMLSSADEISERKIVSLCRSTRNKLITRCVGLLEVHGNPDREDTGQEDIKRQTISDRTPSSTNKQLEANSELDKLDSDFQRETRDDHDCENEPRQPRREPDKRGTASSSKPEITDAKILISESKTITVFIHRTAVDFLKSPGPGKAFLDTNSSPGFDPQVQILKAQLGGLRLGEELLLREGIDCSGLWADTIDEIMETVAKLENSTRMSQVRLCELIDRTMSNLDRRHSDWSLDSHWCTRWGHLRKMKILGQDATTPIKDLDNRDAAQRDPRTFLSFAASHGLSLYVNYVLDCREEKTGLEELNDLLCCSTIGDSETEFPLIGKMRSLILMPELLSRGADPNANVIGRTVWKLFLDYVASIWNGRIDVGALGHLKSLAQATIAFIKHGADLGTIWSTTVSSRHSLDMDHFNRYHFDLQASALPMIELFMKTFSELPRISRMCDARGAVRYLRCTAIRFELWQQKEGKGHAKFNLSEQESKDFVDILKLWANPDTYSTALGRHLSEFYFHLDMSRWCRADAASPSSMDTSDA